MFTNLFSALEEEGVWVHSIADGVSDDGEPVENKRRLIGVLEKELAQNIEDDSECDEGRESGGDHDREATLRNLRIEWDEDGPSEALCYAHCAVCVRRGNGPGSRGEFAGPKVVFGLDRREGQEAICIVFWGDNRIRKGGCDWPLESLAVFH